MKVRVFIGRLNAITVYLTWANLIFFGLFLLSAFFIALTEVEYLNGADASFVGYNLAGIVGFGVAHVFLSLFVKCPYCNKRLTVQGFKPPIDPSISWSTVVRHWFSGEVMCIHCDECVNTNTLKR